MPSMEGLYGEYDFNQAVEDCNHERRWNCRKGRFAEQNSSIQGILWWQMILLDRNYLKIEAL